MTLVYLGLYIALLLWIWGFYAVARMHTMKFKNFSIYIVPVTNTLMIFLIILSISWFILILNLDLENSTYQFKWTKTTTEGSKSNLEPDKKNYKEDIIWNDYY